MENFRSPNFPLVAEILKWLVEQYDPDADIPSETDTEEDRVIFIKSCAQFMALKGHIALNTKNLYQADGYAVREMLKITHVLFGAIREAEKFLDHQQNNLLNLQFNYNADQNQNNQGSGDDDFEADSVIASIQAQTGDLQVSRKLASEITTSGANLSDHLAREPELRQLRSLALDRPLQMGDLEKGVVASKDSQEMEIQKVEGRVANLSADKQNLEDRVEKKKGELERNQKRLETLEAVRPPWMDDFKKTEVEVVRLYKEYLERFRNVSYLENRLQLLNEEEEDKLEEQGRKRPSRPRNRDTRLNVKKIKSESRGATLGRRTDGAASRRRDRGADQEDGSSESLGKREQSDRQKHGGHKSKSIHRPTSSRTDGRPTSARPTSSRRPDMQPSARPTRSEMQSARSTTSIKTKQSSNRPTDDSKRKKRETAQAPQNRATMASSVVAKSLGSANMASRSRSSNASKNPDRTPTRSRSNTRSKSNRGNRDRSRKFGNSSKNRAVQPGNFTTNHPEDEEEYESEYYEDDNDDNNDTDGSFFEPGQADVKLSAEEEASVDLDDFSIADRPKSPINRHRKLDSQKKPKRDNEKHSKATRKGFAALVDKLAIKSKVKKNSNQNSTAASAIARAVAAASLKPSSAAATATAAAAAAATERRSLDRNSINASTMALRSYPVKNTRNYEKSEFDDDTDDEDEDKDKGEDEEEDGNGDGNADKEDDDFNGFEDSSADEGGGFVGKSRIDANPKRRNDVRSTNKNEADDLSLERLDDGSPASLTSFSTLPSRPKSPTKRIRNQKSGNITISDALFGSMGAHSDDDEDEDEDDEDDGDEEDDSENDGDDDEDDDNEEELEIELNRMAYGGSSSPNSEPNNF